MSEFARALDALHAYTNDRDASEAALRQVQNYPSVGKLGFAEYAEALATFVMFGASVQEASQLLAVCVNVQMLGIDAWEERMRVIGRTISTGMMTRIDWQAITQRGIALPPDLLQSQVTADTLIRHFDPSLLEPPGP